MTRQDDKSRRLDVVRVEHVEANLYRVWIDADRRSPYRIRVAEDGAGTLDAAGEDTDAYGDDVDHGFRKYGIEFRRVVGLVVDLHRMRNGLPARAESDRSKSS